MPAYASEICEQIQVLVLVNPLKTQQAQAKTSCLILFIVYISNTYDFFINYLLL